MQNPGTLSVRAHERPRVLRSLTPERMLHGRGHCGGYPAHPGDSVGDLESPALRGRVCLKGAFPHPTGGGTQARRNSQDKSWEVGKFGETLSVREGFWSSAVLSLLPTRLFLMSKDSVLAVLPCQPPPGAPVTWAQHRTCS